MSEHYTENRDVFCELFDDKVKQKIDYSLIRSTDELMAR